MEASTTVKGGYTGKILRVDLTLGTLTDEEISQSMMRSCVGGVGLPAR
jgi:aldehyde:ferredoxin oxidoreductase